MLRGMAQKIKTLMLLAAQAISADTLSAAVNLADFSRFGFLFNVGAFAFDSSNKIALDIHESDDNVTYTKASDADHVGGAVKELSAAGDASKIHLVEYRGVKKYIKLNLNVTGTVSAPIAITGLSTDLEVMPS